MSGRAGGRASEQQAQETHKASNQDTRSAPPRPAPPCLAPPRPPCPAMHTCWICRSLCARSSSRFCALRMSSLESASSDAPETDRSVRRTFFFFTIPGAAGAAGAAPAAAEASAATLVGEAASLAGGSTSIALDAAPAAGAGDAAPSAPAAGAAAAAAGAAAAAVAAASAAGAGSSTSYSSRICADWTLMTPLASRARRTLMRSAILPAGPPETLNLAMVRSWPPPSAGCCG